MTLDELMTNRYANRVPREEKLSCRAHMTGPGVTDTKHTANRKHSYMFAVFMLSAGIYGRHGTEQQIV